MVFSCFPPQTDCEWANLRDFVIRFNQDHGTKYVKTECLDKDTTRKQPEVLLQAIGERDIVIECKSVVWPADYFRNHDNEHHIEDRLFKSLDDTFRDAAYQLTISEDSLSGKKQSEVAQYAELIAREISSRQTDAKSHGIGNSEPIPWSLRPLGPHEIDEGDPTTGIRFVTLGPDTFGRDHSELLQEFEAAKVGYAEEFQRTLERAAPKFDEYADCLKMLLVSFCGECSRIMSEDDVLEIIESATLPHLIDQVWLAQENWVSEHNYEIAWLQVR